MIADVFKQTTQDLYATIFSALSEPARIEILEMIAGTDELPCTVLDETLPISKSTISYHIKILYHAHLITVRKSGRYYHYKLRPEVLNEYLPGFLEHLEQRKSPRRAGTTSSARRTHSGSRTR
jgi:DNA-binding transcriptional ArsR family regulator